MPGNVSITPSLIRGMIHGHVGDFKGFQAAFEGFQVKKLSNPSTYIKLNYDERIAGPPFGRAFDGRRVSRVLSARIDIFGTELAFNSDLAGTCPPNAPEECKDGSKWAPNDPLFWMHHAMIDKVWSEWQSKHEANSMSFEGGSVQRFENITIHERYPNGGPPFLHLDSALSGHGLFPDGQIADVMNTTGGYLCYVYE
ncbi:hypothetical protein PTI98_005975 [Pleurotus ostreatus]|nr:hypothetical protein PTI98_005975 [Pleurotus ostreatus]